MYMYIYILYIYSVCLYMIVYDYMCTCSFRICSIFLMAKLQLPFGFLRCQPVAKIFCGVVLNSTSPAAHGSKFSKLSTPMKWIINGG